MHFPACEEWAESSHQRVVAGERNESLLTWGVTRTHVLPIEVVMYRRLPLRIAAAGAALLAACSGDLNSPAPTSPDLQLRNLQTSESPSPEQLDRLTPRLGGYFSARPGTPPAYLQAGARRGPAEQALAAVLSARGLAPERLQVLTAAYSYRQLEHWFQQASPEALAVTGAGFGANGEARKRGGTRGDALA